MALSISQETVVRPSDPILLSQWIPKSPGPSMMRKRAKEQKVCIHIALRRLVSVSKIVFPSVARIATSGDDPSSKMWILSITHADKHDSAMVERWKADMDGILIYVRL
jgi:hypothetical protein